MEGGIEEQREAAVSLMPPERIIGEHDDVALADGDIDNRRATCEFRTAGQHSADEQIFFGGESQDDARAALGRRQFCLLYTSPSPRDRTRSRMPSSA